MQYCFPPQPLVIDACAELARRIVNGESMAPVSHDLDSVKPKSIDGWVQHQPKKEEEVEDTSALAADATAGTVGKPQSDIKGRTLVVMG